MGHDWLPSLPFYQDIEAFELLLTCSICSDIFDAPSTNPCSHRFCASCINSWIDSERDACCPACRSPISKGALKLDSNLSEICDSYRTMRAHLVDFTNRAAGGGGASESSSSRSRKPSSKPPQRIRGKTEAEIKSMKMPSMNYVPTVLKFADLKKLCTAHRIDIPKDLGSDYNRLRTIHSYYCTLWNAEIAKRMEPNHEAIMARVRNDDREKQGLKESAKAKPSQSGKAALALNSQLIQNVRQRKAAEEERVREVNRDRKEHWMVIKRDAGLFYYNLQAKTVTNQRPLVLDEASPPPSPPPSPRREIAVIDITTPPLSPVREGDDGEEEGEGVSRDQGEGVSRDQGEGLSRDQGDGVSRDQGDVFSSLPPHSTPAMASSTSTRQPLNAIHLKTRSGSEGERGRGRGRGRDKGRMDITATPFPLPSPTGRDENAAGDVIVGSVQRSSPSRRRRLRPTTSKEVEVIDVDALDTSNATILDESFTPTPTVSSSQQKPKRGKSSDQDSERKRRRLSGGETLPAPSSSPAPAPTLETPSTRGSVSVSVSSDAGKEVACPSCTYLNNPCRLRCEMCTEIMPKKKEYTTRKKGK